MVPKLWSVSELMAIVNAGIIDISKHIELIEGKIYQKIETENHSGTIIRLGKLLKRAYAEEALVYSQNPIRMGNLGLPQPDLALLKPREDFYTQSHPQTADAFLLIEIADSTLKYDREVKLPA